MMVQNISRWLVIGFAASVWVFGGCQKMKDWRAKELAEMHSKQPSTAPATFKDPTMTEAPEAKGKATSQPARKKLDLNPPSSRPEGRWDRRF